MKAVCFIQESTCNTHGDVPALDTTEQKKMISEFAAKKTLNITKTYIASNAEEAEIAIDDLRKDGLARRLDCVVICSLWQFGKDIYQAVRMLQNVFYPAGIHFAVLQDDFFSPDKTPEETDEYLSSARSVYHGYKCGGRMKMSPKAMKLNAFGYRYVEEDNRLKIDDESAEVIRQIFNKLLDGERLAVIAKELTDVGAENPHDYMCRLNGWEPRGDSRGWTEGNIYSIAKNPKYAGRWEKTIGGKDFAKDCEPIVDPGIYDDVQVLFARRRHHIKECQREPNPLMRLVYDDDTNVPLVRFKSKKHGNESDYIIRFKYPKPAGADYDNTDIDYDYVVSEIRCQLAREKCRAEKALEFVTSDEGIRLRDEVVGASRSPVKNILCQVMRTENDRVELTAKYDAGEIAEAEFTEAIRSIDESFAALDSKLNEIAVIVSDTMLAFSENNPWIQCFTKFDDQEELRRSYLLGFIEKIRVHRFENVIADMRMLSWRDKLPEHILEVW